MSSEKPRSTRLAQRARLAVVVAAVLLPVQAASAAYSSTTQVEYKTTRTPEARELSDMVASPTYANWYWSMSDVWKTTDTFAACAGMVNPGLDDCRQVQRTRLWAYQIDPDTHAILQARVFALSDPAMALDPTIAQNNDWEDLTFGPVRESGAANLIIGAIGNAANNPVSNGAGENITCDTRRLIELEEPNLDDPAGQTWSPWRIYDLRNYVGAQPSKCNMESLMYAPNAAGAPYAYLVTRTGGKLFARSLDPSTARTPGQRRVSFDSAEKYAPSIASLGVVAASRGAHFSSGDSSDAGVVLLSPDSSTKPCQIFRWTLGGEAGFGATLTTTPPTKDAIACRSSEGLTFARDRGDPAVATSDLYMISDSKSSTVRYWFLQSS